MPNYRQLHEKIKVVILRLWEYFVAIWAKTKLTASNMKTCYFRKTKEFYNTRTGSIKKETKAKKERMLLNHQADF